MTGHLTRLQILEYVEDAEYVDRVAVADHLAHCARCDAVREELHQLILLFETGAIFRHLDDGDADLEDDGLSTWAAVVSDYEGAEREARAADVFYAQLAHDSPDRWEAVIAKQPEVCTAALVQRLVDAAAPELDRDPEQAMMMLHVAEVVAFALGDSESRRARGHVSKQRSNALRMLGRYEEAIDAAIMAENFYATLTAPDGPFEVGQARYTIAVTLFKMTRYPAALRALASARAVLEPFGMTAPLAKVLMLDALIRIEQGEVAAARDILRELLPIEQRLRQPVEAARVLANLAECSLRLGDLDAAMQEANAAGEAFRALGNTAEATRSDWTKAMISLARGDRAALDQLYEIAAVYRELGMPGEAGFVHLDAAEELLRREDWAETERIARELVALFTAAGVTLASVHALDHLRRAVENREATAAVIQYIRTYVAADDPARPFQPPVAPAN